MCVSLTEHVRAFGPACDPEGCVLPRLERLLRERMRRRNLLTAPPAYLGYDLPSWDAPGAFADVAADCYVFAVARRIQGLRNQLRTRPTVDGLITRNVDNFLLERQRRNDPIGYAVFGNVEGAVAELASAGRLTVEGADDGRLVAASVLRLRPPPAPVGDLGVLRAAVDVAAGWSEALPELVATSDDGRAWVAGFLGQLASAGVAGVRVSDLVAAVATRARAEWAARHATPAAGLGVEGEDDHRGLVPLTLPADPAEGRDLLALLRREVPERIAEETQQRVRDGLTAVFGEWVRMLEENDFERLNQAVLAGRVGMADATASDYLRRLREIVRRIVSRNSDG